MLISINRYEFDLSWTKVLYFFVAIAFVLYSFKDLNYNTAFVDEAIYATVGEEVLRGIYWEDAISWMGGSYIYPVISALINRRFGLEGIRLFSTFCVLITGIVAGKIGRKLGGKKVELITLFLFLFSSVSLNLAQLATYDAPSLLFTALSLYTALLSQNSHRYREIVLVLFSAILISVAILTKYVAILFLPIIGILILIKGRKFEIGLAFLWTLIVVAILALFLSFYLDDVLSYFAGRNSQEPADLAKIVKELGSDAALSLTGSLLGLIFALKDKKQSFGKILTYPKKFSSAFFPLEQKLQSIIEKADQRKFLVILLTLGGLSPLTYHLAFLNIRSFWKHMVYASFFWAPVSGWVFYKLYKSVQNTQKNTTLISNLAQLILTLSLVAVITNLWINFSKHWRFQRSWPSASRAIAFLERNRKPEDRIFAEASAIYKYHLFSGFEDPYSWSSTWYLEYKGKDGVEAMKLAIRDRTFSYIILNNYFTQSIDEELLTDIKNYYYLTMEDSYKVSGQYDNLTTIWAPKF